MSYQSSLTDRNVPLYILEFLRTSMQCFRHRKVNYHKVMRIKALRDSKHRPNQRKKNRMFKETFIHERNSVEMLYHIASIIRSRNNFLQEEESRNIIVSRKLEISHRSSISWTSTGSAQICQVDRTLEKKHSFTSSQSTKTVNFTDFWFST